MPRLTKRSIEALVPRESDYLVWDSSLPGFGVRVFPSGRCSYVVQYRVNGRTRRFALGVHGVLAPERARQLALRRLGEVCEGRDPSAERQARRQGSTVRELADRYLEEHARPKKKPASVEADERLLRRHVLPTLGSQKVADVTRSDVSGLHHRLLDTPYCANRVLALLSKMFNLAERWGLRPDASNPCRHVDRYRESSRERFLSADEFVRLGEALADADRQGPEMKKAAAAIRLLLLTGARKREVLELRWEYIDLRSQSARLPDSKTGARTLHLCSAACELLADIDTSSAWVFPSSRGAGPMVELTRPWHRMRERAGLADLRIHDLRHSFASTAAAMGESLPIIGRLLGHSSSATTQRYAHLADDPLQQASEAIGRTLATVMRGDPAVAPASGGEIRVA